MSSIWITYGHALWPTIAAGLTFSLAWHTLNGACQSLPRSVRRLMVTLELRVTVRISIVSRAYIPWSTFDEKGEPHAAAPPR